ncbi:sugar ABC transporter permease [Pseudonocardia zijingensis]|uniref:Sugar ABC transporter permease n=1 Tax=Pseudonocardia zijingensis TaxID=153376 RepID=A0ABN1QVF1_9PSEU
MTAATATRTATRPAGPRPGGRRRRFGYERRRAAYLMLAPALVHLVWWIGIPTVATFVLALTHYDILAGTMTWAGLDNFVAVLSTPGWWAATWNTLVYTFFTVPVAMAIAVVIAVLLNTRLRARAWYRTAVFMPHITATVAIALVWMWMYEPNLGLLNWVLSWFGIRGPAWVADPAWAMTAVIVMSIWKGIGLKMVIYLAALQSIPHELYEAAEIDGASAVRRFLSVTLPMLGPATFFVFIVSLIDSFQVFEQFYVLTPQGGPANSTTVMTYEIYQSAFERFDMSTASAQSVVLFVFLLALTVIGRRLSGRDDVA